MPLPVRVLLVLIHLPTNLSTRALARSSTLANRPSTGSPSGSRCCPLLADAQAQSPSWVLTIDGTRVPVHDQSITAPSKNYRRGINTQIVIASGERRVIVVGPCWPGNRNDVALARHPSRTTHRAAHHSRRRRLPEHPTINHSPNNYGSTLRV